MSELLHELEQYFRGKVELERSEIQHARRLTLKHLDQAVNIDHFASGTVYVGGKEGTLKEEVQGLIDNFRKDPDFFSKLKGPTAKAIAIKPEDRILQTISKELFAFLPEHDTRALIAAYQILLSDLNLVDYSPVIMPVGRLYEGFFAKTLVTLGICTKTAVQDSTFSFYNALESADAKKFKAKAPTHQAQLEAMKQRLKEFRHIQLHSMSSEFIQCGNHEEASRFIERVLRDTQSFFDYFKKYF